MQIKTSYTLLDINKGLGFSFFVTLFWGFIIYSFLLLFELIPPIFGGFFGPFSVIACLLFLATSLQTVKSSFAASTIFAFAALSAFALAAISTITSYLYSDLRSATIQSLELLVFWAALYSIGFYLVLVEKEFLRKISIFLSILFLIYTIYYLGTTGKYMLPFGTYEVENENISGYQSLARNLMIIAFLVIAFTNKRIPQLIYIVMFAVILFAIGSRSEFYAFLVAILAYQGILALTVRSSFIALTSLFVICSGLFINYYDLIMSSRQFNVTDLSADASWVLRNQMEEFAKTTILNHPILGSFGEHIYFSGGSHVGSYAHNALSAYVNYGLIFFILYVFMCYASLIYSAIQFKKDIYNKDWAMCFMTTLAIAFLITFTKPVFWPATYFAWGIFLGTLYKFKKSTRSPEVV